MRPAYSLLLCGLVLPLAASPAWARQTPVAMNLATSYFNARPAPDSARIEAVLSKADNATAAGRMAEARRLYRTLIDEQHESRQYAGKAIWRLASNHIYDGDARGGALLLDDLAVEAARFGDPTMELNATFEAAILWQKVKRNDLAMRNLERVQYLLQSPAISADLKARIQRRIVA
ncbi:MAG: hypothetical protein ABI910_06305 [Gemmatimonadota bacterium]